MNDDNLSNHQLINADSGNPERYTPQYIIEAARQTMGDIDLDPASCSLANRTVQARHYFTITDDGLSRPWFGRVWMNHPYSKKGNIQWVAKLVHEYQIGNISEACCITFTSTSERWFRPLYHGIQCNLKKRVRFNAPDGSPMKSGATKGSTITYLGPNWEQFYQAFQDLGYFPNLHLFR